MTITEDINQKHQEDLQRLKQFSLLDDDFLPSALMGIQSVLS